MKKLLAVLVVLTLCASPVIPAAADYDTIVYDPQAVVEQGALQGLKIDSTYLFLGVPYAKASRFEMPEKPEAWEGVRKAQTYGPISPMPDQTSVGYDELVWPHRYWPQNENCQVLNIWTQSLDESAGKPVLVFFHGGGQTNGSSIESVAYDGKNLSEYGDVVVVTVNHRLNVLGYLDLSQFGEDWENTANLGVADLVASLQWLHDNVAKFGGDPGNVTIFGQSGGGTKVNAILHAPSAEGLVHHAIIESGGGGPLQLPDAGSKKVGELTLAYLGLDVSTIDQIKTVPYRDLLAASSKASAYARQIDSSLRTGWSPLADGEYLTSDYPDWAKNVDLMTGTVYSESAHNSINQGDGRQHDWTDEETRSWLEKRFGEDTDSVLEAFRELFPQMEDKDLFFYTAAGGASSNANIKYAAGGDGRLYTYLFAYEAEAVNNGVTAFHCSELLYAFHNVDIPINRVATGGTEDAYKMQDVVANMWLNFARSGDPSQDGVPWAQYTPDDPQRMIIDLESSCYAFDDAKLNELMAGR
ncbi:MAG: carboxylesterase family protein [Oscillospiraceae bacterium]|nr:carboxylesterase family protein [Oscillospiraceae bacterium]